MKIAIIPARGGSKRIPRKNIRPFLGKPIMAYSILAALSSKLFDQVAVSTEDDEIGGVAIRLGAAWLHRPAGLADDFIGTQAVMRHALGIYPGVKLACCIYATAPFIEASDIQKGHDALLQNPDRQYAFSVTSYEFPAQRALRMDKTTNMIEAVTPEHAETRSQELEHWWHDAGMFYWGHPEAFLQDLPLYSNYSIGVQIPRYRVQDIDTEDEWRRAELMHLALTG